MVKAAKTLAQFKKANKLTRLALHKNGPKSYKRGQGALLCALLEEDGVAQRKLVKKIGIDRKGLKDIVKKAQKNGYVLIEECDEKRTYIVKLTEEGRKLAEKRSVADENAAAEILSCLSDEEIAQLNSISEKLIVSCKEKGICGKKKGRKMRRKCKGGHRHGAPYGHAHHGKKGCCGHRH